MSRSFSSPWTKGLLAGAIVASASCTGVIGGQDNGVHSRPGDGTAGGGAGARLGGGAASSLVLFGSGPRQPGMTKAWPVSIRRGSARPLAAAIACTLLPHSRAIE